MKTSRVLVLGAAGMAAGCGGETVPDAQPGPCWPLEATEGGEATLGTGDVLWEPMPDELSIVKNASQSDPFIRLHSRIRGMPPGDRDDPFDPTNPRTKVSAELPALGIMLGVMCPASLGYVPAPDEDGAFDLQRSLRIGFGSYPIADLDGQQIKLTLEVVGSNKLYARSEKTVTIDVPPAPMDAGVDAMPDAP